MLDKIAPPNRRILLIDDNPSIHEDFRKIFALGPQASSALSESARALLGERTDTRVRPAFEVQSAFHGEEGVKCVREALARGRPYSLAFVDIRMPPGLDGIETITRIWEHDPDVQIVICTAYSDYSWEEMFDKLGRTDGVIILKKPFDKVEAVQLAESLTEKWRLGLEARFRLDDLERLVAERTSALAKLSGKLEVMNQELVAATERANSTIRAAAASQVALEEILQSFARNDGAGIVRALGALKDASASAEASAPPIASE